jgi:2-isopropylmalate synthase
MCIRDSANTPAVCLVGKSHDFHVETALGITLPENTENISKSIAHLVSLGREAMFDAEHFFDGYKSNPAYALEAVKAAYDAGARWVVLCDTNGGAMPHEVAAATKAVIDAGIPGDHLGIHTHNDCEQAIANSLAAVDAGARQVQGTLNGLGERCGNANLTTLIPMLMLKQPYAGSFDIGVTTEALKGLTRISRMLDDILNRVPTKQAAFVGASAFAHKAGLHASAIIKEPSTYEHVDPSVVGNERVIPMSNQAGQSNLRRRLAEAGLDVEKGDPALSRILNKVKEKEAEGYSFDTAQASFELLARSELDLVPTFFDVERYRVISERRRNARGQVVVESEALVTVQMGETKLTGFYKNEHPADMHDDGPVNALWQALSSDLGPYQSNMDDIYLVDFKVRITNGGTQAVTRVIIDFRDANGRVWSTVGVSPNIVDASFEALRDAIIWKLVHDGVTPV